MYDIIFLFSGKKDLQQKTCYHSNNTCTDLDKEAADDKDANHSVSLNEKQTSSAPSNTWRKSNKHISFSQYKMNLKYSVLFK